MYYFASYRISRHAIDRVDPTLLEFQRFFRTPERIERLVSKDGLFGDLEDDEWVAVRAGRQQAVLGKNRTAVAIDSTGSVYECDGRIGRLIMDYLYIKNKGIEHALDDTDDKETLLKISGLCRANNLNEALDLLKALGFKKNIAKSITNRN
jgi:hypothetical protein